MMMKAVVVMVRICVCAQAQHPVPAFVKYTFSLLQPVDAPPSTHIEQNSRNSNFNTLKKNTMDDRNAHVIVHIPFQFVLLNFAPFFLVAIETSKKFRK